MANIASSSGRSVSVSELCLKQFDSIMQDEIARVRDQLEEQIAVAQPLFGEETGEFVDFTRWSKQCARLVSL